MTSMMPPSVAAKQLLDKNNSTANDYSYASGWGRPGTTMILGQQYKVGAVEVRAMLKELEGYSPMYKEGILKEFARLSDRKLPKSTPKGTIALTLVAARELNAFAKAHGYEDIKFTSRQPRPMHPVG